MDAARVKNNRGSPMNDRKPLTPAQTSVLAQLCCYVTMNGYQPSTEELAGILNNSAGGVHNHLRGIALAGWIELTGKPRSIIIPPDVQLEYGTVMA